MYVSHAAAAPSFVSSSRSLTEATVLAVLENQYPGRAYGEPLDIANGVRFLCSSEAKFITGHTLSIDGGLTIQLQEDLGMRQAEFKEEQLASRGPKL